MNSIVELLRRQNRLSVILISILIGVLLVYLSLFEEFLYILVPVEVFFVMHYLKFYRFKPRILGATVIFYVIVIVAAGIYGTVLSEGGVHSESFANGSNIASSVTFNQVSDGYNFSFTIAGNQSIGSYFLIIKGISNSYSVNVSESDISVGYNTNHDLVLSYLDDNITPSGAYVYCLDFGNLSKPSPVGPWFGPVFSFAVIFELFLIRLTISFFVLYEIIFIVGLLIARSISNSARMRNIPPKVPPVPDQPGTIDGDKVQ